MAEDSLYLTTHEAALAVVATAMKKARLLLDTLIVNSLIGGVLFTSGGMLHVMIQSDAPLLFEQNPGLVQLMQGLLYPIGLFYVIVMGVDLFNSNILFFTVGVARGAVTILDMLISWIVSWWMNLVGNIFVCYIVCHYSSMSSLQLWVAGSVHILETKLEPNFAQTLLKAIAGNFFVCLAIYLQLMAKPLHVKFFMMMLPIFTFVSLGFTHSVADMFMVIIGLINSGKISVGLVAWKILLPGAVGNIIGGGFFALVIPYYLHLIVVERDQKKLNLPRFEMRDDQPELIQDSRVIRVPMDEPETMVGKEDGECAVDNVPSRTSTIPPHRRMASTYRKSPANVFPVYGMGQPRERENSIASGADYNSENRVEPLDPDDTGGATYMGQQVMRTLSRVATRRDLEAQHRGDESMLSRSHSRRRPSVGRASSGATDATGFFTAPRVPMRRGSLGASYMVDAPIAEVSPETGTPESPNTSVNNR